MEITMEGFILSLYAQNILGQWVFINTSRIVKKKQITQKEVF